MMRFCKNCREIKSCSVQSETAIKKSRHNTAEAVRESGYCCSFASEGDLPALRDDTLRKARDDYRETLKLIKIEEIEEILKKYDIGKRPLSLILGWKENTLTRYATGDLPTKDCSEMLKLISHNAAYYQNLLEHHKEKISLEAYHKSLAAVKEAMGLKEEELSKMEEAVCCLLEEAVEITPLALQKLLYFAQGFQKAFHSEFMFEEDCEAWSHGPVYRRIYEKYRNYGCLPIEEDHQSRCNKLSIEEKETLKAVAEFFGCYSGKVLERMTHEEEPWRNARRNMDEGAPSSEVIKKESMTRYFNSVREKYNMIHVSDIKEYALGLYEEIRHKGFCLIV